MQIWKKHSTKEVLNSLKAEIAKAHNEIQCAEKDLVKAKGRLQFALSGIKHLTEGREYHKVID
jgi:hypothetical protein